MWNKKNILLSVALFSGLGVFSYLLLMSYSGLSQMDEDKLNPIWTCLFCIVLFNAMGYLTVRLSHWLNDQYTLSISRRWRVAAAYAGVVIGTLAANYIFLVTAKLLVGAEHPFSFPNGGRILILVWLIELVVVGLLTANRSMQQALRLQQQAAALQKENNTARYIALQNQLNPHFLFNSLNTLIAEIEYEPKRAVLFTRELSNVYRYVLQCQDKKLVPLSEELQFASAYLYLHAVRMGDCITCRTEIDDEDMECRLPPLTLQLLVENVVKHNSINASRPMEIHIGKEGDWLVVANRLNPRKTDHSTGLGLKNLSNRCRMSLGRDIQVVESSSEFVVKIPLSYE